MPSVLITGANRGIGLKFVQLYVKQGWDVYAAVRKVSNMPEEGQKETFQIDSSSLTDASAVADALKTKKITLDLIIANAGINPSNDHLADIDPKLVQEAFNVNSVGPLVLFQSLRHSLAPKGKFLFISSVGAGTGQDLRKGCGAYEISKVALNYIVRKLHAENPDIFVAAFSPGWLETDMGSEAAQYFEKSEFEDIKVTVPAMVDLIANGSKEQLGGRLTNWDGTLIE